MCKMPMVGFDAGTQWAELVELSKDADGCIWSMPRIKGVGGLTGHSRRASPAVEHAQGEMSLVGPRPLAFEKKRMIDDGARGPRDLTPGLTELWQGLCRTTSPSRS